VYCFGQLEIWYNVEEFCIMYISALLLLHYCCLCTYTFYKNGSEISKRIFRYFASRIPPTYFRIRLICVFKNVVCCHLAQLYLDFWSVYLHRNRIKVFKQKNLATRATLILVHTYVYKNVLCCHLAQLHFDFCTVNHRNWIKIFKQEPWQPRATLILN
jgi:hypothetical protein